MANKAVFFDRDGTLNVDVHYLHRSEDFKWIPEAKEAIKYVNDHGYLAILVTNQSGVARGYYREEDVRVLHEWMKTELHQLGARIDAFYFCPHHPKGAIAAYTRECDCRKPRPGLILQAMADWRADPLTSLLIGDKDSDVAAAEAAGIRGYRFNGPNLLDFVKKILH